MRYDNHCKHEEIKHGCCSSCGERRHEEIVRRFRRGDTYIFPVYITQIPPGAPFGTQPSPQNITGWSFWCTAKYNVQDQDVAAVFQLTSPSNGIVVQNAPAGQILVTVPPIATRGFPDGDTKISYDVQGKDGSANIFTCESGVMIVEPDVTRAIG